MKLECFTLALLPPLCNALTVKLPFYPNQQSLNDQAVKPRIRNATLADVDAITDIIVDAFAPAPDHKYIFQFRDKYPEYHWECQRQEVMHAIAGTSGSEGTYINVIDAPIGNDSDETKAVAIAAWMLKTRDECTTVHPSLHRLQNLAFTQHTSTATTAGSTRARNCHLHFDMNLTRALQFQYEFNPYMEHYIEHAYERQVYLGLLATHPDYDGLGFGAAHCEWGKQLARQWEKDLSKESGKEEKVNVTLMGTPRGYELYSTIGFENIANVSFTRVEGDTPKELTWQEVMVYQGAD